MSCRIFISYRRKDSSDSVSWLYEKLKDKFGANDLFMDNASISTGDRWDKEIKDKLKKTKIVLIIIGNEWLTSGIDNFGLRRIDSESDWVRQEIEIAIRNEKIIFPILLDGAKMPPQKALPESIKIISNHQAFSISTGSESDLHSLNKVLSNSLEQIDSPDELKIQLEKILISKYKITRLLGNGSRSKVYEARDTGLDRKVAIKVLKDKTHNQKFIELLKDGAELDEQVSNCIHIYGAWIHKDPVYAVMNCLESTLREKISDTTGRGLPLEEVRKILLEVGDILSKAHKLGITHCNIKPSNIMLNRIQEPFLSTLSRIHKINEASVLKQLSVEDIDQKEHFYRENICYLAPEIFDKSYTGDSSVERLEKIDQYMLGLLAYDMLIGSVPQTITEVKAIKEKGLDAFRELDKISTIRKDCPIKLSEIIHKMIDINPKNRYPSINDAIAELKNISLNVIEIAKESYTRCLTDDALDNAFFKTFYGEFIRISPEASEKFKERGIGKDSKHRQYEILREAIFILLMFSDKKLDSNEPNILTRIAKMHNKDNYNISGPTYDDFIKALINTICGNPPFIPEPFDKECKKSNNERERIKDAWEKALTPGVRYMQKRYWT